MSRLGASVLNPRWRACSSGSTTRSASRRCSRRRSVSGSLRIHDGRQQWVGEPQYARVQRDDVGGGRFIECGARDPVALPLRRARGRRWAGRARTRQAARVVSVARSAPGARRGARATSTARGTRARGRGWRRGRAVTRASSRAKNGLPPDVSWILRRVGPRNAVRRRDCSTRSKSESSSGPTVNRSTRVGGSASARPRRSSSAAPDGSRRAHPRRPARPAQRETQHIHGRGIQPLQVVDRQQHRCRSSEVDEHLQCRRGNGALLERARSRIGAEQRDVQGPPLRRGQRLHRVVIDRGEEIAEPGVGKIRFRRARTTRQHGV